MEEVTSVQQTRIKSHQRQRPLVVTLRASDIYLFPWSTKSICYAGGKLNDHWPTELIMWCINRRQKYQKQKRGKYHSGLLTCCWSPMHASIWRWYPRISSSSLNLRAISVSLAIWLRCVENLCTSVSTSPQRLSPPERVAAVAWVLQRFSLRLHISCRASMGTCREGYTISTHYSLMYL